jgi:hypothetical protein
MDIFKIAPTDGEAGVDKSWLPKEIIKKESSPERRNECFTVKPINGAYQ